MKAQAANAVQQAQELQTPVSEPGALELRQSSAPAPIGGLGSVVGDFTGIELARLSMAWGVGAMAKLFHPGDLVIDGAERIAEKSDRLTVVMLSATTYWKDWLTQEENGAGIRPNRYPTREAAIKANKRLDWSVDGSIRPDAAPAIEIRMLVRKPEAIESDRFFIRVGDFMYAPVRFAAEKTVYKNIAQVVVRRMAYDAGVRGVPLDQGHIHTAFYELFTEMETKKTRTLPCPYLVPKLGPDKKALVLSEKELSDLKDLFAAVNAAPVRADDDMPL